jgi:hypothetical protein
MRLVFPLLLILLGALLIGFLLTNPGERVDVTVGTTHYTDVPLSLIVVLALAVGVAFTAVVALVEGATIRLGNRRLRREIQRLETENSFLRSQSAPAPRREPDEPDDRTSLPVARAESEPVVEPPSAPVYDPGPTDAAFRGD